jgi:hypothetical protein
MVMRHPVYKRRLLFVTAINSDEEDLWVIRLKPQIGEQQRLAGRSGAAALWFDHGDSSAILGSHSRAVA